MPVHSLKNKANIRMDSTDRALPQQLVLATRASRLALWQAEFVQAWLQRCYPECTVRLLPLSTRGDEILDRSLDKIGGKGLFVKALEQALLDGRADCAVHSLKDVPAELEAEFELAAILPRGDPQDAMVSPRYPHLNALPPQARVGTSSLRRIAQLSRHYPELTFVPLRGNLDTRLGKLDRVEFDAIILAAAGLVRLGLEKRIQYRLPIAECLPSAGQGTLAIEALQSRPEMRRWLAPLHHAASATLAQAERQVVRQMGGSCQVPLAVHAIQIGADLKLDARIIDPANGHYLEAEARTALHDALSAGDAVARQLISQGGMAIIDRLNAAAGKT